MTLVVYVVSYVVLCACGEVPCVLYVCCLWAFSCVCCGCSLSACCVRLRVRRAVVALLCVCRIVNAGVLRVL